MVNKLITVEEGTKYLDIHPGTFYPWAQRRKIPASKVGRIWRFRKERIDAWLEKQEKAR